MTTTVDHNYGEERHAGIPPLLAVPTAGIVVIKVQDTNGETVGETTSTPQGIWRQSFELEDGSYIVEFTGRFRPIGLGFHSAYTKTVSSTTVNIAVPLTALFVPDEPSGVVGEDGETGPRGTVGPVGPAGIIGSQGDMGPIGATGVEGQMGVEGPAGVGAPGSQGLRGPAGPQGSKGSTGSGGPAGASGGQGPIGPVGSTGVDGAVGETGVDGAVGETGPIGATGPQGDIGLTGETGVQGDIGLTGETGSAGTTDHGLLDGLTDDDHTLYSLADGTRDFSGVVKGITPVATADLTTKEYVDELVIPIDYTPDNINIATGTLVSGDVDSLKSLADGDVLHIDEVTGAPGFLIEINFVDVVETPTRLDLHVHYSGTGGHTIIVQIYDQIGEDWETVGTIVQAVDLEYMTYDLTNGSKYVKGDNTVETRINHTSSGNGTHDIQVDLALIRKIPIGGGGGITDHGALTDLENIDDHLYAFLHDGSRPMTGDLTLGGDIDMGASSRAFYFGGVNVLGLFWGGLQTPNYLAIQSAQNGDPAYPVLGALGESDNVSVSILPKGAGRLTVRLDPVPTLTSEDTLTNKTLTTPIIGDMSNAQHDHADAAGGGALDAGLTGETGVQGVQGDTGLTGETGVQGDTGAVGATGPGDSSLWELDSGNVQLITPGTVLIDGNLEFTGNRSIVSTGGTDDIDLVPQGFLNLGTDFTDKVTIGRNSATGSVVIQSDAEFNTDALFKSTLSVGSAVGDGTGTIYYTATTPADWDEPIAGPTGVFAALDELAAQNHYMSTTLLVDVGNVDTEFNPFESSPSVTEVSSGITYARAAGEFTVNADGIYDIGCTFILWVNSSETEPQDQIQLRVYVDASQVYTTDVEMRFNDVTPLSQSIRFLLDMTAGEKITFTVNALDVSNRDDASCFDGTTAVILRI